MGKARQYKLKARETKQLAGKISPPDDSKFELTLMENFIADELMEKTGRAWVFRSGVAHELKLHQGEGKALIK